MDEFDGLGPDHVEPYFEAVHEVLAAGPCPGIEQPVSIRWALTDAGSYVLRGFPDAPGSAELEEGPPAADVACTVRCTLAVLLDLACGRKRPIPALLRGYIRVSGDRTVFQKGWALVEVMQQVASEFRARTTETPSTSEADDRLQVEVLGASVHTDTGDSFAVYHIQASEAQARWITGRRSLVRRGRSRQAEGQRRRSARWP